MLPFPNYLAIEIIENNFHYPALDNNVYRLSESKCNVSVDISVNKKDKVYCFSFDMDAERDVHIGDPIFPFFKSKPGLRQKNDFILVCEHRKKVYILLIELKSKDTKGYLKQLCAGKILFDFILERIKLCDKSFADRCNQVEYRGLLFSTKPVEDKSSEEKPEFKTINSIDFPVAHLSTSGSYYLRNLLS